MLALSLVVLSVTGSINAPAGVRLLDDAPLLAQAPPPLVPLEVQQSDAQASAAQLEVDLAALKRARPSLGPPITLLAVGGGVALLGVLYLSISGLVGSSIGFANPLLIIGIVGLGIGLPLAAIGAWMLYNRLEDRARIDARSLELRRRLQELKQPPAGPPPPPPPAPILLGPEASLPVAVF